MACGTNYRTVFYVFAVTQVPFLEIGEEPMLLQTLPGLCSAVAKWANELHNIWVEMTDFFVCFFGFFLLFVCMCVCVIILVFFFLLSARFCSLHIHYGGNIIRSDGLFHEGKFLNYVIVRA